MEAAIPKESMLAIEEWPDWRRPLAKNSTAILSPLHRPAERCPENERARRKVGTLCTVCMRVAEIREIGRIGRDCFRYTARTKRNDALRNICLFGERRGIVLPSTIPLLCVDACDRTTRQNSGTRAQNQKYDGTKDGGSSDQRIQRDRRLDKGAERQGERSMRDDGRGHETTDHEPRDRRRRERV